MSKKRPLLIESFRPKETKSTEKFIFKYGDDLRQDNLVLQLFKIMDRLWAEDGLKIDMVIYEVMETGFETGYIEFVDNSNVISAMHKDSGFYCGPYKEDSILQYFLKSIVADPDDKFKFCEINALQEGNIETTYKDRLADYHKKFMTSLAGQCVATYILGIRDRHPSNFMLELGTGRFFHIDFGHFLDNCKSKFGFKRDREPFIYSDELNFFLKKFSRITVKKYKGPSEVAQAIMQHPGNRTVDKKTGQMTSQKTKRFEEIVKDNENRKKQKTNADSTNVS